MRLRKLVLPVSIAVLLAMGVATVIASGPLNETNDVSAVGVANLPFTFFTCGFTANGTYSGEPLLGKGSFTLIAGDPAAHACAAGGQPRLGALTLTKNDGSTLVMDLEVNGIGGAVVSGTFSAPANDSGPVGAGITLAVPSGKFQNVVGAGTIVFGTGYDDNTNTYDTTPTLHLNGTLLSP